MRSRSERTRIERPATANDNDGSGKTVIRVKRGALRRCDRLRPRGRFRLCGRTTERRAESSAEGPDRRRKDRRQAPPFTWDAAEFVVVGDRSQEPEKDSEPEARRVADARGRRRS